MLLNNLNSLLDKFEIIHLTGELDWNHVKEQREQLPMDLAVRYHAMPYLHEMGAALAAADLVISRAGPGRGPLVLRCSTATAYIAGTNASGADHQAGQCWGHC